MNASPLVVPDATTNSSSSSHGRSTVDWELNAIRYWSFAVVVGGVAYPVFHTAPAAAVFGSSFAGVIPAAGVVPAEVTRLMPTTTCIEVGTPVPARTPRLQRRSLYPLFALDISHPNPVADASAAADSTCAAYRAIFTPSKTFVV